MTEIEKYLFDLQGYLVIEDVLTSAEVADLNRLIEAQNLPEPGLETAQARFGGFLSWGKPFCDLLDHPRIMPLLKFILGDSFRLDHYYGIYMRDGTSRLRLHGGNTPYDPPEYYHFRNGQMYNGLTVVSWNLTDTGPAHGGFCCIPASHKANYPCPPEIQEAHVNDPRLKRVDLSLIRKNRDVWPVDRGPASNITRRDVVCCARESAAYTEEGSLSFATAFIHTTAYRTGPGGITGVNFDYGDTNSLSLVRDKALKLIKRPAVQCSSLRLSNRHPITNAVKVFQGNRALCVLSLFDNAFADHVVGVASKTTLFTRQFFELAFSRFGLFLLEFTSQASMPMPDIIDVAAGEGFAIRIGGDVDDSQINAKRACHIYGSGIIYIAGRQQIEVTLKQNEVAFPLLVFEQFPLTLTAGKRRFDPAFKSPDGNGRVDQVVTEQAGIVGNTAGYLKGAPGFLVQFVSVGNLGDTAHNHLSGQIETLPNVIVNSLLELVLAKRLMLPGVITDIITCLVSPFKRLLQEVKLLLSWLELNLCRKFHILKYSTFVRRWQMNLESVDVEDVSGPPGVKVAPRGATRYAQGAPRLMKINYLIG